MLFFCLGPRSTTTNNNVKNSQKNDEEDEDNGGGWDDEELEIEEEISADDEYNLDLIQVFNNIFTSFQFLKILMYKYSIVRTTLA